MGARRTSGIDLVRLRSAGGGFATTKVVLRSVKGTGSDIPTECRLFIDRMLMLSVIGLARKAGEFPVSFRRRFARRKTAGFLLASMRAPR